MSNTVRHFGGASRHYEDVAQHKAGLTTSVDYTTRRQQVPLLHFDPRMNNRRIETSNLAMQSIFLHSGHLADAFIQCQTKEKRQYIADCAVKVFFEPSAKRTNNR